MLGVDAGVPDAAAGVAPDEAGQPPVTGEMAPGDSAGADEGVADQGKSAQREAGE